MSANLVQVVEEEERQLLETCATAKDTLSANLAKVAGEEANTFSGNASGRNAPLSRRQNTREDRVRRAGSSDAENTFEKLHEPDVDVQIRQVQHGDHGDRPEGDSQAKTAAAVNQLPHAMAESAANKDRSPDRAYEQGRDREQSGKSDSQDNVDGRQMKDIIVTGDVLIHSSVPSRRSSKHLRQPLSL